MLFRGITEDISRWCLPLFLVSVMALMTGCNDPNDGASQDPPPDPPPTEPEDPPTEPEDPPIEPEDPPADPPPEPGAQPNLPSPFRSVSIQMDPANLNELYSRNVDSDERLPASVTVDDMGPFPVEMRFRGNSTRHEPKKGFNIRFDDGDQSFLWDGDRINARAMWRDPSFVREHMSMWLFREYAVYAPQTFYFELFINDVFEGFYMHVERIDRRFSRYRGLNRDATLVRDQFRDYNSNDCGVGATEMTAFADNNWGAMSREQAIECISSKFNDRRADWDEVLDLLLWVDGTQPGEQFAEELAERVDLDSMVRFFGTHVLVGDMDALWGNDYWMYKDHEDPDGKWHFIPWDKNLSMGSHVRFNTDGMGLAENLAFPYEYTFDDMIDFLSDNRLFRYFLETPSLRAQVTDWVAEQIESEVWQRGFDDELAAAVAITTPYGKPRGIHDNEFQVHEGNYFDLYGDYELHVEQVRKYRDLRTNYLRQKLAGFSGPRHEVDLTLSQAHPAGETLWLVDGYGFTVGRFIPDEDLPAGTQIALQAVPGSTTERPINHDWLFSSDRELSGNLAVYYRNDTWDTNSTPSQINWYNGGSPTIGRQPDMNLVVDGGGLTLNDVQVQPLINRISAQVQYTAGGGQVRLMTEGDFSTPPPFGGGGFGGF